MPSKRPVRSLRHRRSSRGRSLSIGAPQSHSASAAAKQRQWSARPRGASSALSMMITLQKDRYETLGHLGSGATSRVEKVRDNVIGRIVARKTFLNGFGEDLEQQFLREAQIIGQLSDPCIVQLYDVGIDEHGTPFLVMEYVAGKTLEDHLGPSTLSARRACAWAADLAGALALANLAWIIHGDA